MKASYLGAMGYSGKADFPATWPVPPAYDDPATSVASYQEGIEECEYAEEVGFEWVSFSEHHYSGADCDGGACGDGGVGGGAVQEGKDCDAGSCAAVE